MNPGTGTTWLRVGPPRDLVRSAISVSPRFAIKTRAGAGKVHLGLAKLAQIGPLRRRGITEPGTCSTILILLICIYVAKNGVHQRAITVRLGRTFCSFGCIPQPKARAVMPALGRDIVCCSAD